MPSRASSRGPRSTAPTARWRSCCAADPQRRVYVRRINVAGNTRTRDEVVRREFRQFESSWYDGATIKLSRDRVDRLGYFSEVDVETSEVPGTPDQVDLTVNVTEKPTGNLLARRRLLQRREAVASPPRSSRTTSSARATTWASSSTPASPTARWCCQHASTRTSRSTASRARFDLFYRTTQAAQQPGRGVRARRRRGGSVRFGVPFTEFDTVFFGIGFERTEIGDSHRHAEQLLPDYRELRRDQQLRSR